MSLKPTPETQPVGTPGPGPPAYQPGGQPQTQPPPLSQAQIGEQYRAEREALSSNRRWLTYLPNQYMHGVHKDIMIVA